MKVVITGANGHLGRRLIRCLAGKADVTAIVRSTSAQRRLTNEFGEDLPVAVVDYSDAEALAQAFEGASYCVHLVGIIKESKTNTFEAAHEAPARALVKAASAAHLRGILYLSIAGSSAGSTNACLASRGRAEAILLAAPAPTRVIRVPMVLGEGDYASFALLKQARRRVVFAFRATSLEQPIYAGDVIDALMNSLEKGFASETLELAGSESLSRADLIRRAAGVLETGPVLILSLPLALGLGMAWVLERLANPPVTRAMLGVLDHDDHIDTTAACERLGLQLTSLDETIRLIAAN